MYRRYYYLRRRKFFLKQSKEFKDSHKDYYKEYSENYRKKNKKRIAEVNKKWHFKNRDRILRRKRKYYHRKREELGIKSNVNWWNERQDNLLKKYYGKFQAKELIDKFSLLKNRSISSINYRVHKLKLHSNKSWYQKEKNPMWKRHHSEKAKKKQRYKANKRFENKNERLRISKAIKKLWQNPEYAKNQIKVLQLKPTLPEKQVMQIVKLNKLPFNYTGDGKVILNGLCPDFLSKNPKYIIEINGEYWHRDKNRELRKKRAYNSLGYKLLIIWSKKLQNPQKVTEKIINFYLQ